MKKSLNEGEGSVAPRFDARVSILGKQAPE